jgi:hypothetical protein
MFASTLCFHKELWNDGVVKHIAGLSLAGASQFTLLGDIVCGGDVKHLQKPFGATNLNSAVNVVRLYAFGSRVR